MSNINMIPQYNTKLFTEVWSSAGAFVQDLTNSGIVTSYGTMPIKSSSAQTLYYLLYARYGNNPIANLDVEQFKYKVFGIIFSYGPTWEKRLDIQSKLRALQESDIIAGSKAIYNTALNPSQAPSTASLEELDYINSQNTTNYKKSKMDAYAQLWDLLDVDVTQEFLNKFKVCFKLVVRPERVMIYETEEDEDDE